MKRIITFFIAAGMCFALVACSNQEVKDTNNDCGKIYIRITNEDTQKRRLGKD